MTAHSTSSSNAPRRIEPIDDGFGSVNGHYTYKDEMTSRDIGSEPPMRWFILLESSKSG
jgi:hypothetical protein